VKTPCSSNPRRKTTIPSDLPWHHPLAPYQVEGANRLLAGSLLLADEMGLGKTIQAIAALRILARSGAGPALIVAPAGLLLQWRAELRAWAPELRRATVSGTADERSRAWASQADVYLVGYESLNADAAHPLVRRRWAVVIADEAQRIKNARTLAKQTLCALPRDRAWALTGTPLENRLDDLISILDFVAPGRYDRRSLLPGLRRLLAEVQLRRRRADVLPTLPPKFRFVIPLRLGPAQRRAYDAAEQAGIVFLRSLGTSLRVQHILELILRLKQICNAHPRTGESAKLDDLVRRVDAFIESGEKILVFSQFVAAPFGVTAIRARLAHHHPATITGEHDAATRAAAAHRFATDERCRVLILSLRTGGLGLNLTTASIVFRLDDWWTPASAAQAEDRAHRRGQTRPVQAFSYHCQDTIESRIAAILARKQALFDAFVDGNDLLQRLALPELLEVLGIA
jgi:SNF2 family DNA or RNA helicase